MLFDHEDESYLHMNAVIDGKKIDATEYALENHSARATASRITDLFRNLTAGVTVKDTLRRPETWVSLIESQDEWRLDDLRNTAYNSRSKSGKALAAGQSFPMVKIKRLANELGYQDYWSARSELWLKRG